MKQHEKSLAGPRQVSKKTAKSNEKDESTERSSDATLPEAAV